MLKFKSFCLLCAMTIMVSIGAIVAHDTSIAIPGSGQPLFPDLLSKINEVKTVQINGASGNFSLQRSGSGWVAPDRFGYPAAGDKVHKLLIGIAGLERIEPKTRKPELYSKLGLKDPGSGTAGGVYFALETDQKNALAALIVGKILPAKGDPEMNELYVRLPDDPQSWLVEGKLPNEQKLTEWLERGISEIDRKRVRQVTVNHQDGEVVEVHKDTYEENDFRLSGITGEQELNGQWRINDIGRSLTDLELSDVRPRETVDTEATAELTVTMISFDGLVVELELFTIDDAPVAILKAAADPSKRLPEARLSVEQVQDEAAGLNDKWAKWAYVLPEFKADHLSQRRTDLLKAEKAAGAGASG